MAVDQWLSHMQILKSSTKHFNGIEISLVQKKKCREISNTNTIPILEPPKSTLPPPAPFSFINKNVKFANNYQCLQPNKIPDTFFACGSASSTQTYSNIIYHLAMLRYFDVMKEIAYTFISISNYKIRLYWEILKTLNRK